MYVNGIWKSTHVSTCETWVDSCEHLKVHIRAHTYVDADAQDAHAQRRRCKMAIFSRRFVKNFE